MTLNPLVTNTRTINKFKKLEKTFKKIHNNFYSYEYSIYTLSSEKIVIMCPIHGVFEQLPSSHIQGKGCKQCGISNNQQRQTKNHKQFVVDANIVHKNKYTYKAKYVKALEPLLIFCEEHGDFSQRPNDHLNGQGCPKCAGIIKAKNTKRLYYNKPTTLYYVSITKPTFPPVWKIGITTKINPLDRFKQDIRDGCKVTLLYTEQFPTGKYAFEKEHLVLNTFKVYKYIKQYNEPILRGGNTELLLEDCFIYDYYLPES